MKLVFPSPSALFRRPFFTGWDQLCGLATHFQLEREALPSHCLFCSTAEDS